MEISCNVIRDLLPLYAEDMVSEDSEKLVRDHIARCPACRDNLTAMRVPVEIPMEKGQSLIYTVERIMKTIIVYAMAAVLVLLTFGGVAFSVIVHPIQGEMEEVLVSVTEQDGLVAEELTLLGTRDIGYYHFLESSTGQKIKIISYYKSLYTVLFGTVPVSDTTYINDYPVETYQSLWYYQDGELIHLWGDETEPKIQLEEGSEWLLWALGLGVLFSLLYRFFRYEKLGNIAIYSFNVAIADLILTGGHWFPFVRTGGDRFFLYVWLLLMAFLLTFSIVTCRYLWRNRTNLF